MSNANYALPVSQLLTYEEPLAINDWSAYLELGLNHEHIPALIEIILDEALYLSEEDVEFWAPVHAWRTLAELQAETAIDPLIQVLSLWGNDENWWEWINEEFPEVFRKLGVSALGSLATYLRDAPQSESVFTLGTAISCIEEIAKLQPESRADSVQILTGLLERFAENSRELNGYLVSALGALKALESLAVIEQAYTLDCVDEAFIGDWEDFQVFVGLKEPDPSKRRAGLRITGLTDSQPSGFSRGMSGTADPREKAKRKSQKEARRKNRRKKK
jgi:hypothetical protein